MQRIFIGSSSSSVSIYKVLTVSLVSTRHLDNSHLAPLLRVMSHIEWSAQAGPASKYSAMGLKNCNFPSLDAKKTQRRESGVRVTQYCNDNIYYQIIITGSARWCRGIYIEL